MSQPDPDGEWIPVIPDDGGDWYPANVPGHSLAVDHQADTDLRARAAGLVHQGQNSYFPDMATAAGKELVSIAHHMVNMMPENYLKNKIFGDFGSDASTLAASKEANAAAEKPGGRFAQMVTDTAGTAPIGGPIEAGLAKLSPLAKSLVSRIATSAPGRSGIANAVTASTMADPGQKLTAAEEGGGLGTILGAGQSALGRTMSGIVKKSDALQRLEGDVTRTNAIPGAPQRELFAPVSQGANMEDPTSAFVSRFYKSALPYAPGVETQLANQAEKAGDTVRGMMLQTGAPDGYVVPANATKDMQLSTKAVKDTYDTIYAKLRDVDNITTPKDFAAELKARIQKADPQIPESDVNAHVALMEKELTHQGQNNPGNKINGWNLKNVRDFAQANNSNVSMPQRAGLTNTTKEYIDDIFAKKYQQAFNLNDQRTMDSLAGYPSNRTNYENFRPLAQAVKAARANSGDFSFGKVANRANDQTDIQGFDQDAKEVLGQKPAQITQAGRILTYPVILGAGAMGPLATASVLGGARGMATRSFQQGLYGDTALQKSMKTMLDNNPKLAAALGFTVRDAATQAAQFGRD